MMVNRHGVPERVDVDFRRKVIRLFPEDRSFAKKTKRLNSILNRLDQPKDNKRRLLENLDEILYGR